jgi:excisionase family DNA binding protein
MYNTTNCLCHFDGIGLSDVCNPQCNPRSTAPGRSIYQGVQVDMDRILHPRRDAADLLSISLRKLDRLILQRNIKTVRIGRRRLVPDDELRKFAQRVE